MATSSAFTPRFPEARFRSSIRDAMKMGMPQNVAEQVTWYWRRVREYRPEDPTKNPYSWTQTPTVDQPGNLNLADPITRDQSLVVDYSMEFKSRPAGSATTVLGEVDTSRALITVFDVDYAKIHDADYAKIGNSTYRIQFVEPATGLFGVTMYTVVLEAEDQAS